MVRTLQIFPILLETAVGGETDTFTCGIQLRKSLTLEVIALPGGYVASLVDVGNGEGDGELSDRLEFLGSLGRSGELYTLFLSESGESLQEIKYTCR